MHRGLNSFTVVLVLTAFVFAISFKESTSASHFGTTHGQLGLTIVCLLPIFVSLAIAHVHPWHRLIAYSCINLAFINMCLKFIPIGITFLVIFNGMYWYGVFARTHEKDILLPGPIGSRAKRIIDEKTTNDNKN